ncbi:hypothetical protein [Microvirga arabica]|uniref:hypothetical protein n=1 Tax=Microvirga arabica TaxID=1128671 RepID=UPI001939C55A|nr:hypothetical protein [Microvirga arabica]MBM1169911.1 hypothetical protein [Microvirga arabica]
MKIKNSTRLKRRKAPACLNHTDRQRDLELLAIPVVRAIVRRSRVSPVTAALLAELSGLSQEAFRDGA